jgi:glycosyltransferase involved in cell wall biosynthesis
MNESPLVSVIMNCLNCEAYVLEAIESVYAQTYSRWEIIFYDNASTDKSGEIANRYDERLRYFRGDSTIPLGAARNQAIQHAEGEFITFLDCDDTWLPGKLDEQLKLFAHRPDIDLAYANFYFTRNGKPQRHIGFRRSQPEGDVFGKMLGYFSIHLLTVMVRKSALVKLGELFDPSLNLAEDYDVFLRLLYKSKAAYDHKPLSVYRMHEGMSSVRYADKYPSELIYCIDKLRLTYPGVEAEYEKEFAYLKAKAAYWKAKAAMLKGNKSEARSLLQPYKSNGVAFFGLYYSTYLSIELWLRLQNLRLFLR